MLHIGTSSALLVSTRNAFQGSTYHLLRDATLPKLYLLVILVQKGTFFMLLLCLYFNIPVLIPGYIHVDLRAEH